MEEVLSLMVGYNLWGGINPYSPDRAAFSESGANSTPDYKLICEDYPWLEDVFKEKGRDIKKLKYGFDSTIYMEGTPLNIEELRKEAEVSRIIIPFPTKKRNLGSKVREFSTATA
ncbi:MAG: hypothetical protein PHG05_03870 [Candidatus Nanoarchaeia archaeon]|nr:hypothetical protein [Candidatus Nanoarchaeia archaeon]